MSNKIVKKESILSKLKELNKKKVVLCHGVFDLLHVGHIDYLNFSKTKGDLLVVSVTSDKYVKKGLNRPYFSEKIRAKAISSLECVDLVIINDAPTAINIINLIKPIFYIKGADYKDSIKLDKNLQLEKNCVQKNKGKLLFASEKLLSSSKIINNNFDIFNDDQKKFIDEIKKNYSISKIKGLFKKFENKKVLLVGETIIDEYIFCDTIGKSGKEPMLVNKKIKSEKYVGGIIAVANHIASFCKSIDVVSFIGSKNEELELIKKNLKKNVKVNFVKKNNSPTIVKSRLIDNYTKNKIIGIYDLNDENIDKDNELSFSKKINKFIKSSDLTIVVDYGHGIITPKICKLLENKSKFLAVNSQLNSLNQSYHSVSKYSKADFICIHEGELHNEFRSKSLKTENLMTKLKENLKTKNLLITQGKKGSMSLTNKMIFKCPSFASKVIDRIGAGDTMMAVTSLCFVTNFDDNLTLFIGNVASGNTVSKMGTTSNIDKESLLKQIEYLLK